VQIHHFESRFTDVVFAIEVVLQIPQAASEGTQRKSIQLLLSYEDALEMIHKTIGCVHVHRKLVLSYKLSTSTLKSAPVNLCSESDWDGCLEEVQHVQAKRKGRTAVSVSIIVPD